MSLFPSSTHASMRPSGWRGGRRISRFGAISQPSSVQNSVKGKSSPHACALVANIRHGSRESNDTTGHRNRCTRFFPFASYPAIGECLSRVFAPAGPRLHRLLSALSGHQSSVLSSLGGLVTLETTRLCPSVLVRPMNLLGSPCVTPPVTL